MPEPLKNLYSEAFFQKFFKAIRRVLPQFKEKKFLHEIFVDEWEAKELKQRVRHISTVLKNHLP